MYANVGPKRTVGQSKFESPQKVIEQVLEHEQFVTSRIHLLYKLAVETNEYPTQMFLQWFVNEQVEEEKNVTDILENLKLQTL